jgi:hypothetical protein
MMTDNPTALRIGMSGTLNGHRYTVRASVVMSARIAGQDYAWNEYYLSDSGGSELILVYEQAEDSPTWKEFRYFEPLRTMSAKEVTAKRAGEYINFDNKRGKVTDIGQSRVEFIEGHVDGLVVGSTASYFNAVDGATWMTISCTDEQVEYYVGHATSGRTIEIAFGLSPGTARDAWKPLAPPSAAVTQTTIVGIVIAALAVIGFVTYNFGGAHAGPPPPPPKQSAPADPLAGRRDVTVGGISYAIRFHAVAEIGTLGKMFDRHEYMLMGSTGDLAWLVQGLEGNHADWHLFSPYTPPAPVTAYELAGIRAGRVARVTGRMMMIRQLFLQESPVPNGSAAAKTQYGLIAQARSEWLVARWAGETPTFYLGRQLSAAEVSALLTRN